MTTFRIISKPAAEELLGYFRANRRMNPQQLNMEKQ
jgi:hypothetical protein